MKGNNKKTQAQYYTATVFRIISNITKRAQLTTVLCCAVLCCAVLCCAVLCCAVLCCAVLCCAVLCCAVLCKVYRITVALSSPFKKFYL